MGDACDTLNRVMHVNKILIRKLDAEETTWEM